MSSLYRNVTAHPSACLSPAAGIIGTVTIGAAPRAFAGAQLRENATIHVARGADCVIGNDVTVGHGAIVHGCTLEDHTLVGMGAIVLDGARIRTGSLVAAGALVTGGKDFPENSLIMGSPAKAVRTLSPEEVERMVKLNAAEYVQVAKDMVAEGMLFHPAADFDCQIGA